jgi:hypothetical protein
VIRLRQVAIPVAYMLVLAAINFYLCRGLFSVEFTAHTNSIQGLWISMARLAGEHWFRPSWWPYQDSGMPFEHTYMPLVPAASALLAIIAGVSAARAFHGIMGLVLCFGPVTLFLMIWRMSGMPGYAFWVCMAYSITSPARALLPEGDVNPIRYWSSLRFYTAVVWDDLPHETAVCFLPLALLFLWRSLEKRRMLDCVFAVLFMALTVLPSVFGATALLLGAMCILAALPRERLASNARVLMLLALLAYLVVSPFLPPSLIATIRSNQQRFVEDRWSAGSLTALGLVLCGAVLLHRAMQLGKASSHVRFFVLFGWVAASIPLIDAYLNRHFLPQPNRYHAELEMGLAMAAVPAIAWAAARIPRDIRVALSAFVICVAGEQVAGLHRFTEEATRPVDMTQRIEYRIAQWVDGHMPGERVMVPGSIAQWFNVFSATPQLSGSSYSTTPNWHQQDAMKSILTSVTPEETGVAVLWAKAFGLQAVTAAGPHSPEFWKGPSSTRFDGLLPVLWRQEDTTIYQVPQRSASLAHVIPLSAVVADGAVMSGELQKYVAALDDESLPLAGMQWHGFRNLSIDATVGSGQVVSVQTCYHRGWHARANGNRAESRRDGLGFLVVNPRCAGPCHIELTYDGGWEYRLTRWLSALTILGILAWIAFAVYPFNA